MLFKQNVKLSPPWQSINMLIKNTIGATPGVEVSDLESQTPYIYKMYLDVDNISQAECLSMLIQNKFSFGRISLIPVVRNNYKEINTQINNVNPQQIAECFCNAFKGNPFTKGSLILNEELQRIFGSVAFVFQPSIVQFYNDDYGDLCGNYNEVAAKSFIEVLKNSFGSMPVNVTFSTYNMNCPYHQDFYCFT